MSAVPTDMIEFLIEQRVVQGDVRFDGEPLAGGVSSDIWRVDAGGLTLCVKRALARLRVKDSWHAPVERNAVEWSYLQISHRLAPGRVPAPVAHDSVRGVFAMAWLDADDHVNWKEALLAGRVDVDAARGIGSLLGRLHQKTAHDPAVAVTFATDEYFHALRIEPYLMATAARNQALAPMIEAIAEQTRTTRHVLVHGDLSPKNIMLGPSGPVLLDAECAWYGDPAFDVAFLLNHLTIKRRIAKPTAATALANCASAFLEAYLPYVEWEDDDAFQSRAARLLPVLALARVDGRSPVEYLSPGQASDLAARARSVIAQAPSSLGAVLAALGQ